MNRYGHGEILKNQGKRANSKYRVNATILRSFVVFALTLLILSTAFAPSSSADDSSGSVYVGNGSHPHFIAYGNGTYLAYVKSTDSGDEGVLSPLSIENTVTLPSSAKNGHLSMAYAYEYGVRYATFDVRNQSSKIQEIYLGWMPVSDMRCIPLGSKEYILFVQQDYRNDSDALFAIEIDSGRYEVKTMLLNSSLRWSELTDAWVDEGKIYCLIRSYPSSVAIEDTYGTLIGIDGSFRYIRNFTNYPLGEHYITRSEFRSTPSLFDVSFGTYSVSMNIYDTDFSALWNRTIYETGQGCAVSCGMVRQDAEGNTHILFNVERAYPRESNECTGDTEGLYYASMDSNGDLLRKPQRIAGPGYDIEDFALDSGFKVHTLEREDNGSIYLNEYSTHQADDTHPTPAFIFTTGLLALSVSISGTAMLRKRRK